MVQSILLSLLPVTPMSQASAAPFYADKLNLLTYIDEGGQAHATRTPEEWAIRRGHILANMQLVMGPLPKEPREGPPAVNASEELETGKWIRQKITYEVAPGDRVPAFLFLPKGVRGKRPAMLCLHQTIEIGKGEPAGLGGSPDLHYAQELAERGYVTLAPDYPNFGDYKIDVYARGFVSATMKGIVNHVRAIDLLQSLPEVDPERIGVIGHSLGGHNSLFVAAFDERIKVAVTSCGFNSFAKYYGGDLTGWSHNGYMPRIASEYGRDPARMPFDFTEVLGAIAPRAIFVNAPLRDANFEVSGIYDCLNAARPVYSLFGAEDRLMAVHPDCEHSFPPEAREKAYEFVERVIGKGEG
ncbi:MAG: alpha/beta fold hydrolase [Armatimonadetes bacterium]|nr:alpha/beta fold hydrolase [Armatimonadota bacterium]